MGNCITHTREGELPQDADVNANEVSEETHAESH